MTRDESIALFERCEAARAAARDKALAEGKPEYKADNIAHEAAKAIWNGEWAEPLLAERKRLEETGRWADQSSEEIRDWRRRASADFSRCRFLERGMTGTKAASEEVEDQSEASEPPVKQIRLNGTIADWRDFQLPGDASFASATFTGKAWFASATFSGKAWFVSATFSGDAWFASATFSGDAWFASATFSGDARFARATFSGPASFDSATFSGPASFDSATFSGTARFASATFSDIAWFDRATFSAPAWFASATFSGDARFASATFSGTASFDDATFSGDARFDSATFSGDARFHSATFAGEASFERASLAGNTLFPNARFKKAALFRDTRFLGDASFNRAIFESRARFDGAAFSGKTTFGIADFSDIAFFSNTTFRHDVVFYHARFHEFARFNGAEFHGLADFYAIRGERGFSMARAHFEQVPDFIQAHFEEAPRLDNVTVVGRMIAAYPALETRNDAKGNEMPPSLREKAWHWTKAVANFPKRYGIGAWLRFKRGLSRYADLHDIPARWRALKRLAVHAHDQDREHEFFARELRSGRFATEWPLPLERPAFTEPQLWWANWLPVIFWRGRAWLGAASFWGGVLYGCFSDYGRSILRPALWWAAGVVVAAIFYLGEVDGMRDERRRARAEGAFSGHLSTALDAWRGEGRPCHVPRPVSDVPGAPAVKAGAGEVGVSALSAHLRRQTTASREAVHLALRDGFLILYGDADTAHRTYGCMFGVELYGGESPVAIVPPQIANWSAIHKLYSAVMIFLFGLALRNMLKMK